MRTLRFTLVGLALIILGACATNPQVSADSAEALSSETARLSITPQTLEGVVWRGTWKVWRGEGDTSATGPTYTTFVRDGNGIIAKTHAEDGRLLYDWTSDVEIQKDGKVVLKARDLDVYGNREKRTDTYVLSRDSLGLVLKGPYAYSHGPAGFVTLRKSQ